MARWNYSIKIGVALSLILFLEKQAVFQQINSNNNKKSLVAIIAILLFLIPTLTTSTIMSHSKVLID